MKDEDLPWDVKKLELYLGGEDDTRFIKFVVFDDKTFNMYEGGLGDDYNGWFYEDIDLSAARRLRDFLNYAVPDKKE